VSEGAAQGCVDGCGVRDWGCILDESVAVAILALGGIPKGTLGVRGVPTGFGGRRGKHGQCL